MGLKNTEVEVELNGKNIKWFEDKGYEIPRRIDSRKNYSVKRGTKIKVRVEDLLDGSNVLVDIKCDECNKTLKNISWRDYKRCVRENGTYYCQECAIKLHSIKNNKIVKLKNSNMLNITHPHLIKFFINEEDVYKYSYGSNEKILMKCPNCGYEKKMAINTLVNQGFSCPRCSDGKSYPEKFMFNILEQLNINFISQLTKITFKWCKNYLYDFYLFSINCIIEIHGIQHYTKSFTNMKKVITTKEIQENDNQKKQLARENEVGNYIVIDCRYSNLNWIKNNIMNSDLPELLNFKEEDIDWLKCHEYACNSLVKIVCEYWNNGIKNTLQIGQILKLDRHTVSKYLKQGVELGWCNYDSEEEKKKGFIIGREKLKKPVICLITNEIFNSQMDAYRKYFICSTNISACCKGKQKSAGKHPETGEKMVWMYYEEYLLKTEDEIKIIIEIYKKKRYLEN